MVGRQKIGFVAMGLCVLLHGCAHDRTYSLALETADLNNRQMTNVIKETQGTDGVNKTPACTGAMKTVVLKSEVDEVIGKFHLKDGPAGLSWTIRDFQIELRTASASQGREGQIGLLSR